MCSADANPPFPAFGRAFLTGDERITMIGGGEIGGKAKGLASIRQLLQESCTPERFPDFAIGIPTMCVVGTDVFAEFMERNGLYDVALSDTPDDRIAHAFQKGELPAAVVGDLRALIAEMRAPLAIRSSSLLEDALRHPFAGTYATKMIPNNQADVHTRFTRLTEAIKYVWASTFFADARSYMRLIGHPPDTERMAVIIQEVVGQRCGDRFYPPLAGVIRTYNYYPTGPARPDDGVVNLALGLGKTIVDGGVVWTYSPAFPRHAPPFASARDLLKNTQTEFWAVNMGPPPPYDPVNEAEYLVHAGLTEADYDGTLRYLASTYDAESDRIVLGTGRPGPRVLNFAPLLDLEEVPVNRVIEHLARLCKETVGCDVEIEFALTLGPSSAAVPRHRFGFLQLRPMRVDDAAVAVADDELRGPRTLVGTDLVMGNGALDGLDDVVYVRPDVFDAQHTPAIARELEPLNRALTEAGRRYVLIGFGRWGSSDPWLGIPVTWPQICSAQVIVEATTPTMDVDPSQGSHFFHNMTSFRVCYLTVHHAGPYGIDWAWLNTLPAVRETNFLRHVRTPRPLEIRVDGRNRRGVIRHD